TQQNAALVEEATAAARSMEEQAQQLSDAVSQFRLADTVASSLARVAAAPSAHPAGRSIGMAGGGMQEF
ncbi:hypothetical protein, partial [Stenotrophomonas nitritireducens]